MEGVWTWKTAGARADGHSTCCSLLMFLAVILVVNQPSGDLHRPQYAAIIMLRDVEIVSNLSISEHSHITSCIYPW
jgi:hypothetical protein